MITLEVSATNHKGYVRRMNEDMMLISSRLLRDSSIKTKMRLGKDENCIFAVADGLGGCNGGEVASEEALRSLSSFFYSLPAGMSTEELHGAFDGWILKMHNILIEMGRKNPDLVGMGTTLVALVIYEGRIYWLSCGDSRMYRLRSRFLSQMTKDHSLESITGQQEHAHILVNSIGAGDDAYLDFYDGTNCVYDNDLFMLCSDGLTNLVPDELSEMLLNELADSERLVEEACNAGGTDNVSVCLIHITFN